MMFNKLLNVSKNVIHHQWKHAEISQIICSGIITRHFNDKVQLNQDNDLIKQLKQLAKSRAKPEELLNICKQIERDMLFMDETAFFIQQQALIKLHCQNKQYKKAMTRWFKLSHNPKYETSFKDSYYQYYHAMRSFLDAGYTSAVINVFKQMINNGVEPNHKCYNVLITAVSKMKCIESANNAYQIIQDKLSNWMDDRFIQNGLINMYLSCGDIEKAQELFNALPESSKNSRDTWCVLLNGMIMNNKFEQAFELFDEMKKKDITINTYVYSIMTKAISRSKSIDRANALFDEIENDPNHSVYDDIAVCASFITMFSMIDNIDKAAEIWQYMYQNKHDLIDIRAWMAIMNTYYYIKDYSKVIELYTQLIQDYGNTSDPKIKPLPWTFDIVMDSVFELKDEEFSDRVISDLKNIFGKPNNVEIYAKLIKMVYVCSGIDRAIEVWRDFAGYPNTMKYNIILRTCVESGQDFKAWELFDEMQNKYSKIPLPSTFIIMLNACRGQQQLVTALHDKIIETGPDCYQNEKVLQALINVYNEYGNQQMVDQIQNLIEANTNNNAQLRTSALTSFS